MIHLNLLKFLDISVCGMNVNVQLLLGDSATERSLP